MDKEGRSICVSYSSFHKWDRIYKTIQIPTNIVCELLNDLEELINLSYEFKSN